METSDRNYAIAAVQNVVGIDDRAKQITDLLEMEVDDEVRILGIYGADGIGKTTLAKAVYDRISSCFDSRSFLTEVKETAQNPRGIQFLQTRLVRDILERDHEDPSFDERIEDFLDIFCEKKVLIVVDDVEEQSHLHAIVRKQLHWFGPGSRIIVTSENEEILREYDPEKARTYTVGALDDGQAFELFCEHAFKMQSSIPDYDGLTNRIVNATEKLPLAVEVVGSFLRGKSIQEWAKMEKSMKERTRSSRKTTVGLEEILDICCKELDQQQKDIFLDIACFISGVDARIASYMWPNCYLPSSGCILMPLAKTGENIELQMHRLLRCLGKRICKKEESQDPRSRRFCTQDMVLKAMNKEKGMGNVEALCFDFTAGDFQSMPKIRFLKLDNAKFCGNFAGAFASLRWLCWQRCPPDFDAENLVLRELAILELPRGKITEDWGGWRKIKMAKLKVLNLTGCSDLLFTPEFSGYKDLEILILEGCSRLVKLDTSIGKLKRLVSLNLKFCSRLNWLPVELGGMTALKELFIDGTSVREIPISIGNLNQLETLSGFQCFPLTHLPSSVGYLTALSELSLDGAKITELPISLGELSNLRRLSLRDCRYLEELPNSIGKIGSSLEELDISATNISELPGSIGNLKSLKVLRMDSSFVRAFPGEIGNLTNLEELHASWCRSLKGAIPGNIKGLRHLKSLTLRHSRISSLPPEISTIPGLHTLDLLQCNEIEELPKLPPSLIRLRVSSKKMKLPPSLIRLRVSSKRMKAIPLLEGLKELEELCLSDRDPKARRPSSSKWPVPESNVIDEHSFSISSPKLRKLELSLSQVIKLKFGPADIPPPKRFKMVTHAGSSRKEVSELPKTLSVLKLYDSAVEEIEGLEGLAALKRLDISNCRIQNLNGIGQLTSLRSLILSDCDCLSSLDLSNLMSLKVLEIRRCKMIHQIEGLDKLTSLVKPNISECPALTHVIARSAVM
ncbi:disease resistance protein TAO1-like [Rhodamnia argentea]|uniref:Disease resistance protein TAO1-like n=1 Tax=Rhodamnia argentea TaxID=178133 RepID=A0ABM3HAA7_9MYRT|nr:disease resistance protein TAO1-like [Rhodamnia argentea]